MKKKIPEKIVVAANFTIEPISGALVNLLAKVLPLFELVIAPYNQIFQQLLVPASLFNENRNGVNVVFLRLEDLIDSRGQDLDFVRTHFDKLKTNAIDLVKSLSNAERFSVPLIVFLCPASAEIQTDPDLLAAFDGVEQTIREAVSSFANLYVFGTDHIASRYSTGAIDDPKGNILGHVPYTASFVSALAVETVRKIDSYFRKPLKVLVLDCDNTLWDGVVGEDGVEGIGFSDKRLFIQTLAIEQSESGMVVCLNSRNNEQDVWEVFETRTDMPLKRKHVVSSRINWLPKSQNLRSIADELQLGLESFVFVDDDPAVCDEVQRNCPEVLTILLPSETDDFRGFFDHLWIFEKLKVTEEDRERTRSYQDQERRREHLTLTGGMAEFLAGLELVCEISELSSHEIPRVSQLSLRTNQFNSTTIRLSEADVRSYASKDNKFIWTVKVRDRFGDYGLVGVVIFGEQQESLVVESFMLSCRVLGRGVEHQIVRELGKKAHSAGRNFVSFHFDPTEKNAPILHFFKEIGELNKTVDARRTTYELPASVAFECEPGSNSDQAPSFDKDVPIQKQTEKYVNTFGLYIDLAHSLSTNGWSTFEGPAYNVSRAKLQSEFRTARTDTERKLTQIWEQTLRAKNIGTEDDFFEIGGDSLVAVALFVEIEEQFGRSLPISSLLEAPTIETLARMIEFERDLGAWKYLVPIQPQGTKPALFCMHAAGGNVLFYRDLADGLGNDQPVYGLQAKGITDKSETAHDRVEDMAVEYLKEICRLQPNGPYRLCGSSFGGLVAFECAKQLVSSGKSVSALAVFDTYAPGYLESHLVKPTRFSRLLRSIERVRHTTNQLREIRTRNKQIAFVFDRINRLKDRQKRKILWKKNEFAIQYNKATGSEFPSDLSRNHKAITKAEEDYHPQSYDGRLILIRASDQPRTTAFDPFLGWKGYINSEIVTEEVRGIHGSIAVYPSAAELAQKLSYYLDENETSPEPVRPGRTPTDEREGRHTALSQQSGAI